MGFGVGVGSRSAVWWRAVVALVGGVAPVGVVAACAAEPPGPAPPLAEVIEVIDGDTVVVRSGSHTEAIRLLGIDTPEVAHHGNAAECFGPEAAARTAALLPAGSTVRLDRDVEARDVYGRVLAFVTRPDGVVVNLLLVGEGLAEPLTIPPNRELADAIAGLAADARAAGRGMWGACPPSG